MQVGDGVSAICRKLKEFIKEVYNTDLMKSNYLDYLDERLPDRDYAVAVTSADFELLRAILTYYVRHDRFVEGAWANSAKEGVFLKILYRLKELGGYLKVDDSKLKEAIKKAKPGLEKYMKIMNLKNMVDVSRVRLLCRTTGRVLIIKFILADTFRKGVMDFWIKKI